MNKKVIYAALMFVVTMSSGNASAQQLPYQNPALSAHERAVDLCGRLTLEEKASLMLDDSPAIPRLGIKRFLWWSEALHGVANMGDVTVFPEPIGMAASFNDRMVYRVFDATSDEMRAKWNELQQKGGDVTRFHALSVWTPNVNIFRDPRWGRGQETYGEDPYLTSRMGCAVVRGLQGPEDTKYRKLWACAKHYAIHSGPEWARHTDNITDVTPRDLWETYMPAGKGGYLGGPYYKICIEGTTRYLTATAQHDVIAKPEFTGEDAQLWRIEQLTDGTYRIMPKAVPGTEEKLALVSLGDCTPGLAPFDFNSDNSKWNFRQQ
jgi:beta-glucosidase